MVQTPAFDSTDVGIRDEPVDNARATLSRQTTNVTESRQSMFGGTTVMGGTRTFYEGELTWKTGIFSSTKVFATTLKDDPSFYVIDQKLLPRVNGEIPDRVDPYEEQKDPTDIKVLLPGWTKYDLKKCLVYPNDSDNKGFKVMVNRNDQGKAAKEEKFFTANVCGRTIWVKKLGLAAKFEEIKLDIGEEMILDTIDEDDIVPNMNQPEERKMLEYDDTVVQQIQNNIEEERQKFESEYFDANENSVQPMDF